MSKNAFFKIFELVKILFLFILFIIAVIVDLENIFIHIFGRKKKTYTSEELENMQR